MIGMCTANVVTYFKTKNRDETGAWFIKIWSCMGTPRTSGLCHSTGEASFQVELPSKRCRKIWGFYHCSWNVMLLPFGGLLNWLVVYLLWKIWVRQLGWLFPIYPNIWKNKTHVPHHQPIYKGWQRRSLFKYKWWTTVSSRFPQLLGGSSHKSFLWWKNTWWS